VGKFQQVLRRLGEPGAGRILGEAEQPVRHDQRTGGRGRPVRLNELRHWDLPLIFPWARSVTIRQWRWLFTARAKKTPAVLRDR
jgi:hypothetical protein